MTTKEYVEYLLTEEQSNKAIDERAAYQAAGLQNANESDKLGSVGGAARSVGDVNSFEAFQQYVFDKWGARVDASLKELDLQAVIESATGVEKILDNFPAARAHFAGFSTSKTGIMACDSSGQILYNPRYYSNYETAARASSPANGFHPKNTGIMDNGTHEAGHLLELTLIRSNSAYLSGGQRNYAFANCLEAKSIVSEACRLAKQTPEGKGLLNTTLERNISEYGLKNASECLAEAVSDYYRNGDEASILSKTIVQILKERLN